MDPFFVIVGRFNLTNVHSRIFQLLISPKHAIDKGLGFSTRLIDVNSGSTAPDCQTQSVSSRN